MVVGRVGGLLSVLFVVVAVGEALLADAELAVARVALLIGFFTGGTAVRDVGFAFSVAFTREATAEVLELLGEAISAPDERPASRSD